MLRSTEELVRDFLRRIHRLPGLVDYDAGRPGGLRIDLQDDRLRNADAAGLEGRLERRAEVDHLAVRRPQPRLHQEVALLLRRRIEQDVRDALRRQIEFEVHRVPVGRPDLAVLELVAALGIRLDQPDHVVLADETEPAVSNLNRRQEVAEVHPSVGIHLEAVPLREMPQDPGHRATEQLDLFVVQQELTFTAAVRAEFLPEISVRTTFLEHRPFLGSLVFANGLRSFVPATRRQLRLPDDAKAERFESFLDRPDLRLREGLAVQVGESRPFRPLDGLIEQVRGARGEGIGREEMSERDPPPKGEVRMPRHIVPAADADRDRRIDRLQAEQDPTDDPRGLAVPPLPLRAALLDVERRRGEIGTVVGCLEGHLVTEMPARLAEGPERRRHPTRGRRDEGLRLSAELRDARIPDWVDRQTGPSALGAVCPQADAYTRST